MKEDIKNLIENTTPVPICLSDGTIFDGNVFKRHISCISCSQKDCLKKEYTNPICDSGFRIIRQKVLSEDVIVFGIVTNNSKKKLPRNLSEKLGRKAIDDADIIGWIQRISLIAEHINRTIENKTREYLAGFHDITPSISALIRNTERVIDESLGNTFAEKFEKSSEIIKTIYKSAEMLNTHIKLMSFLINPDSINYGSRRNKPIYKIIDKTQRLLMSYAMDKKVRFVLKGESKNTPYIFDSFVIIIFVILDNAIKYSLPDQDINIEIMDIGHGGVYVDISSYGPIVPEDEIENIFKKRYRYIHPNSHETADGQGIGLYVASKIAEAHKFSIKYKKEGPICNKNNVPHGESHFMLEIPYS